jgi:hypothetical protein
MKQRTKRAVAVTATTAALLVGGSTAVAYAGQGSGHAEDRAGHHHARHAEDRAGHHHARHHHARHHHHEAGDDHGRRHGGHGGDD